MRRFFPSMVYLSNSKVCVAVLGNLGFAAALGAYKLVTWVSAPSARAGAPVAKIPCAARL